MKICGICFKNDLIDKKKFSLNRKIKKFFMLEEICIDCMVELKDKSSNLMKEYSKFTNKGIYLCQGRLVAQKHSHYTSK